MYMIFECGDKVYAIYNHNIFYVEDNMLSGSCNTVEYCSHKPMRLAFKGDFIDAANPVKINKIHCFENELDHRHKLLQLVKPQPVDYNCQTMPNNTMGIVISGFKVDKYKNAVVIKTNDVASICSQGIVEHLSNPSFIINLTHNIEFTEITT